VATGHKRVEGTTDCISRRKKNTTRGKMEKGKERGREIERKKEI
jgi:hypothetical protein